MLVSAAFRRLDPHGRNPHARFAAHRLWLRIPRIGTRGEETVMLDDPEVRLALSGRSGPLVVEIEYRLPRRTRERFTT